MRRALAPDFVLGGLLVAIGLGAAWIAAGYPQGTLRFMGPGFAPRWLGLAVIGLGALIAARGLRQRQPAGPAGAAVPVPWRALLCVAAAPLIFGLALPRLGLVIASFATVLTVAAAIPGLTVRKALATAGVLSAGLTVLFAFLLRVPLPVWPS